DAEARPPEVEGDRDLDGELLHRAAAEDVVEDAQARDGEAAEEEGEGAASVGVEDAAEARRVEDEREKRRVESGDDGDAAQARDARGMHLPRVRDVIEEAAASSEPGDHRNERAADECGGNECYKLRTQRPPSVPDVGLQSRRTMRVCNDVGQVACK